MCEIRDEKAALCSIRVVVFEEIREGYYFGKRSLEGDLEVKLMASVLVSAIFAGFEIDNFF